MLNEARSSRSSDTQRLIQLFCVATSPWLYNAKLGPSSRIPRVRDSSSKSVPGIARTGLKGEDEHERLIDCAELVRVESSRRSAEPLRIDDSRLLCEHTRFLTRERDRRPEARGAGARRGGRDEKRAQAEEFVGLHDDRVAAASLLVSARALRRREPEDLATYHQSSRDVGASSASCSRMTRISSRSCSSAASMRTSSRTADRSRRRAAASRSAMRTASESLSSPARTISRAAAEASSRRTCSDRAIAKL